MNKYYYTKNGYRIYENEQDWINDEIEKTMLKDKD